MAGVQASDDTAEEIRNYFLNRRHQSSSNHSETDNADTSTRPRSQAPRNEEQPSKCESLGILISKPKYRQYSTLESRTASFEAWPEGKSQDTKQLAEAGFAYTGVDDSVRCFYCNIGLRDWPYGACPWEQHILASPKCGHVTQCKGKSYIRKILGQRDIDSDFEVDDSNDFVDTVKEAIQRNESAVKAAREYCADEEMLKTAVKHLIRNNKQKQITVDELKTTIKEIEEINLKQRNSSHQPSEDRNSDIETYRKLKEPITCKICFNAIACIITLPCGHMVSCSQCIPALSKCAICRAEIKGTVRALMAV